MFRRKEQFSGFTGELIGTTVETDGSLRYKFFPIAGGAGQFTVKASLEARIALTTDRLEAGPMYEIIFDSTKYKKTLISKNRSMPPKAEIDKTDFVVSNETRSFWVYFDGNTVSCGHNGASIPFITWTDPEPLRIFFMGICTVDCSGTWQIKELYTYGNPFSNTYYFYPVSNGILRFNVDVSADAKVVLTTEPEESDSMCEITIGGEGDTKSWIKKRGTYREIVVDSPDILSLCGDFWIKWDDTGITVGCAGEPEPLIPLLVDYDPIPIFFFGICSGKNTAKWEFEVYPTIIRYPTNVSAATNSGIWVHASNGQVPYGAVVGGQDVTGEPSYVARIKDGDETIPGRLIPSRGATFVSRDNTEYSSNKYQVLVHSPTDSWVATCGTNIPMGAVHGGVNDSGEILYIGRVFYQNMLITGWVQRSRGVCCITDNGKLLKFENYQVLMY